MTLVPTKRIMPSETLPGARRAAETVHDLEVPDLSFGRLAAPPKRQNVNHEGPPSPNQMVRQTPRYAIRRPLLAIPLLVDGSPDWDHRCLGTSLDVSVEGLAVELATDSELPTLAAMLVLQETASGHLCVGVEVCDSTRTAACRLRLGTRFGGFARRSSLKPENLYTLGSESRMAWIFGSAIGRNFWRSGPPFGVLTPVLWDRVQVCPRCQGLPRFCRGCSSCGSGHVANDRLIHHFACAHVAPVADFEKGGDLVCPKCRTRHMIVGSDYEYAVGPFHCGDCHWTAAELQQVAQCLRCEPRAFSVLPGP